MRNPNFTPLGNYNTTKGWGTLTWSHFMVQIQCMVCFIFLLIVWGRWVLSHFMWKKIACFKFLLFGICFVSCPYSPSWCFGPFGFFVYKLSSCSSFQFPTPIWLRSKCSICLYQFYTKKGSCSSSLEKKKNTNAICTSIFSMI